MMRAMGAAASDGKKPLVLVGQHGRQRVVTAVNAMSVGLGLRVGMPAIKAQALVPELVVQPADPDADAQALDRLAVWALRYSPVVATDPPAGVVVDTTGADHLHGGETAMAPPTLTAMMPFHYRTGAATNSITAVPETIRGACRPKVFARVRSPFRIFTSTALR
jgi:protein ImuB